MADPWAQFSTTPPQGSQQGLVIDITPTPKPQGGEGDPWAAFATAPPAAAAEPSTLDKIISGVNTGVNWLGTQATKAATGMAGTPRSVADLQQAVIERLGGSPAMAQAATFANPVTAVGQFLPSTEDLNKAIFQGGLAPEVKMPGKLGPAIDAGTQAALSTLAMPGSIARNVLPAFTGGASQEIVGNVPGVKGTAIEPLVRLLTGVGVGGATAAGQNYAGNVLQGVRNLAPNVEDTASKLLARAAERDKTDLAAMIARQQELGPGTPLVEAGGPNVRGTMRGAIAAPGEARTTAQELFDTRRGQITDMAQQAVDRALGKNPSMAATVEDITAAQKAASRPAYQAAGIPSRIQSIQAIVQEPGTIPVNARGEAAAPVQASSIIGPDGRPIPLRLQENMPKRGTQVPSGEFNTPNITSPAIDKFLQEPLIQRAINKARTFGEYKDLPSNSMAMLDKAYKNLGDLETAAKTPLGAATERSRDIGNLRRDFRAALVEANPQYGKALQAFAGPQRIKDAVETGRDWFKGAGTDPTIIARQKASMSPEEWQVAKEIGVRDWAREAMRRSDRGVPGAGVWGSPSNRDRLKAILEPAEFAALEKQMGIVKNAAATATDIGVGSRTAPMLAEQADNASQAANKGLVDLLMGRPLAGATKIGSSILGRISQGKTEAVNAKLAEYLSTTDPAKVGLVQSLAEKARQAELARRLGRAGALQAGVLAPAIVAGARQ